MMLLPPPKDCCPVCRDPPAGAKYRGVMMSEIFDQYLARLSPTARRAVQNYINTPPEQQHMIVCLTMNLCVVLARELENEHEHAQTRPE